jgi:hypothetical protein
MKFMVGIAEFPGSDEWRLMRATPLETSNTFVFETSLISLDPNCAIVPTIVTVILKFTFVPLSEDWRSPFIIMSALPFPLESRPLPLITIL